MEKSAPSNRSEQGPFDQTEVAPSANAVNLGSLLVNPEVDVTLKVEVDENSGQVVALTLERDSSVLQVVAFAAPSSEGMWAEVMDQLRTSISASGGAITEHLGELGPFLVAEIPQADGFKRNIKFIGVDGPRWFLRGTVTGAALQDPVEAASIDQLFRSLIVVRGNAPMPPREPLPLLLPEGVVAPPRASF